MEASFSTYLSTWGAEFLARADRVRHLIGSAHWLSDGSHKESLLIQFFERHISRAFHLGRGFVRPLDESRCCSPEIDVLIADFGRHPPLFNEGDLLIVPPSSVAAHLQSKSAFSSDALRDAIANVVAVQHVITTYRSGTEVWRGIVFASCPESRDTASIVQTLKEVLADRPRLFADIPTSVTDCPTLLTSHLLPKCIATYDRFAVFLVPITESTIRIKAFDIKGLGLAYMACDLFSFLTAIGDSPAAADLSEIITNTTGAPVVCEDLTI